MSKDAMLLDKSPPSQLAMHGTARRGSKSKASPRHLTGYGYLLPAFVVVVGILYFSVGYTAWLSGYDWDGISPDRRPVGLGNYAQAWSDDVVFQALRNMAIYSLTIVIQLVLGLLLAALLHSRIKGANIYKVIFVLPVVIAPAVMAPILRDIFAADGQLNQLLGAVGMSGLARPWLADPNTALYALMLICIWQTTGFAVLLYYASLTQLDPGPLEAARIDGAGNFRMFFSIIVPMMRPMTITLAVIGVIGVLKTFDIPYLITGGGPNNATQFLSVYIYQQGLTNFHVGYASALSMVLLVMALLFAIWQTRPHRRKGGT